VPLDAIEKGGTRTSNAGNGSSSSSSFRHAGYPDDPAMHGLVAGLWSSLSGIGRFTSRAGSGILVDYVGFEHTAAVALALQCLVVSEGSEEHVANSRARKEGRKEGFLWSKKSA